MDEFLRLKKRRSCRRIIEGTAAILSLTALIVLNVLKENSKVVTVIDVTPFLSYEHIEYTNDHSIGFVISALIMAIAASLLLADFVCTRIYHTQIDGEDVIVYNGLGLIKLSVGGEEKDAMFFKGYLETKLKSGVTITVSPQFFMSYHITFSDDRPSIDL